MSRKLQWGRVLMNAETSDRQFNAKPIIYQASMGPRSHERGNLPAPEATRLPEHECFNGAAFS